MSIGGMHVYSATSASVLLPCFRLANSHPPLGCRQATTVDDKANVLPMQLSEQPTVAPSAPETQPQNSAATRPDKDTRLLEVTIAAKAAQAKADAIKAAAAQKEKQKEKQARNSARNVAQRAVLREKARMKAPVRLGWLALGIP